MLYTIEETKTYLNPAEAVFAAALGAVEGLEGKVVEQNPEKGTIEIQFNKTIHGKVLGDRTKADITLRTNAESSEATDVSISIYPIDPVGRKLMFGARKGVARTVLGWFFAHVEHRLDNK